MRPESPNTSSVRTLISHAACSLRRGGEGGVSEGLFESPETVIDGQKDEFGLGEWQDSSCLVSRNATCQEQAVEHNLQQLCSYSKWCQFDPVPDLP